MKNENTCTLKSTYNSNLVEECRKLGGKWDAAEKIWVFSDLVKDEVDALDAKYNSDLVKIEVTVLFPLYGDRESVKLGGYGIARAFGRDSGAKIEPGVAFIQGQPKSGGSHKNWHTEIPRDSVFRFRVPVNCLDDLEHEDIEIKVLD